ncbi:MAG TPA: aromatic ring-hydroxylating dioxygenase subunit alpha [Candidatus Limnocylindria bacterium]|nr:aromatic ring-hydroxylating dioxygenase subunit alpha [Candidatus Limnocylindria bacterium]
MAVVEQQAAIPRMERLRACWHGVAYSRDVGTAPYRTVLLGEPLVIWRDSGGMAHVFRDLCIHRGTALSLGRVVGDEIVCPYHGWRYAAGGRCTAIPQLEDPTRVPARARVAAYQCHERYGVIWVALDEPRWPIPDLPELEGHGWKTVLCGPFAWNAEASRQIENFTDLGHFPWVHPGLLGDPSRVVVVPHEVRTEGHVLHYQFERPEAKSTSEYPLFPNEGEEPSVRLTRYELHLPYTIVVHMTWRGREKLLYLFVSQPVAADRCIGYCLIGQNYNLDQPDRVFQEFEDVIFEQDRRIVESQRPEQVPFDLAAELHLKFDAVAIAYRRAMLALDLGASV